MPRPISDKVARLRQRQRADGSWRVWWEAEAAIRPLGFTSVDLSAGKPTWSVREARRLNKQVDDARTTGARPQTSAGGRTMAELIRRFRASDEFREKAPATRKTYSSLLNTIEAKWGDDLAADFTKPALYAWHQSLKQIHRPRNVQAIMRMTHQLFNYAEWLGWRAEGSSPTQGLHIKTPPARNRILSWDESDALVATADAMGHHAVGTAILLGLWQGQRQTDILNAHPQDFQLRNLADPVTGAALRMLVWSLQQSKRGSLVAMAIHPELRDRIKQTIARVPADATHLLIDETTGRPYADPVRHGQFNLFAKRFAAVRAKAAKTLPSLADCQFRDLRRTQASRARLGGVSRDDAGDLLGNTVARDYALGDAYMPPQVLTATRAVLAVQRPENHKKPKGDQHG